MLTEICNLDCWMCDFARSKKLTKVLPFAPEEVVELLRHPVFFRSLRTLTFTGGEPFAYPRIKELYAKIRAAYPNLRCNFSTNCTLLPKMLPVLHSVTDWNKVGLLVSVDGIAKHDLQRGREGSFDKTLGNLELLREHYPKLSITLKFTITPINYDELQKTYELLSDRGFRVTAKMLEHNPHYTNKLSIGTPDAGSGFTPEQLTSIERQLKAILSRAPKSRSPLRTRELQEVLESLSPLWERSGSCYTPSVGAFIDCDLNLFTCKEYDPVLNLRSDSLDRLGGSGQYRTICDHEAANTGKCTRCTSQMKIGPGSPRWLGYLASLVR